jgi:hypothetical protein
MARKPSAHMHTGLIMAFDPLPDGGSLSREEVCQWLASAMRFFV